MSAFPDGDGEAARWRVSAAAWDRWADELAPHAERLNSPLLDAAEIAPGHRVIDLACGAGEPALSVADRVGKQGLVVACDFVPAMLAATRRRDPGGSLRLVAADMEALPFADAMFDRVTCRFGLMFCPSPERSVAEARRVLAPQGRAAFMVWGPTRDNSLFDLLAEVGGKLWGTAFESALAPLFRYADAETLIPLMRSAGFSDPAARTIRLVGSAEAGMPFWRAQLHMCAAAFLADTHTQRIDIVESHLGEAARARATTGRFPVTICAHIVTAVA